MTEKQRGSIKGTKKATSETQGRWLDRDGPLWEEFRPRALPWVDFFIWIWFHVPRAIPVEGPPKQLSFGFAVTVTGPKTTPYFAHLLT
jgi:hypothetical protein